MPQGAVEVRGSLPQSSQQRRDGNRNKAGGRRRSLKQREICEQKLIEPRSRVQSAEAGLFCGLLDNAPLLNSARSRIQSGVASATTISSCSRSEAHIFSIIPMWKDMHHTCKPTNTSKKSRSRARTRTRTRSDWNS